MSSRDRFKALLEQGIVAAWINQKQLQFSTNNGHSWEDWIDDEDRTPALFSICYQWRIKPREFWLVAAINSDGQRQPWQVCTFSVPSHDFKEVIHVQEVL